MPHAPLDNTEPLGNSALALGDDQIRNFKSAVDTRLALDHNWDESLDETSQDGDGFHKKVSLVKLAANPTPNVDQVVVFSKVSSGKNYPEVREVHNTGKPNPCILSPVGMVVDFAGTTAPDGWLMCDGSEYIRTQYAALFDVIGTTFGASDATHFNVPDCRGRVRVHPDSSAGRLTAGNGHTSTIGAAGGNEIHALTQDEMPAHTHTHYADYAGVGGGSPLAGLGGGGAVGATTTTAGGSLPHNNVQPYIALNAIIKT